MIRTYNFVEMTDIYKILSTIARTINISLIDSIEIDNDYTEYGYMCIWIEWDIPNYSIDIDEAIADYIESRIRSAIADEVLDTEKNSTLYRCRIEEQTKAINELVEATLNLELTCLGN